MNVSMRSAAWVVLALLASAGPTWAGPEVMKHSGIVTDIDEKSATIVVAEVGPWERKDGETVLTYRRIHVAPDTPLVLVQRVAAPPSGFPGDFVESTLAPWGLTRGDFVTVECVHVGRRLLAQHITVAEPDAP